MNSSKKLTPSVFRVLCVLSLPILTAQPLAAQPSTSTSTSSTSSGNAAGGTLSGGGAAVGGASTMPGSPNQDSLHGHPQANQQWINSPQDRQSEGRVSAEDSDRDRASTMDEPKNLSAEQ